MPVKHLTDNAIKAAIATTAGTDRRQELRDKVERGLVLRLSPKGAATFVFNYRPKGQRVGRCVFLGRYPDAGLAFARKKASDMRRDIAEGVDPVERRQADELAKAEDARVAQAKAQRMTFRELAEEYITDRIPKEANRIKARRLFNADLLPDLGDLAIEDVTAEQVDAIWRRVKKRGAHMQATHAFSAARAALNFAVDNKLMAASPLHGKRVKSAARPRERFLNAEEIRTFLAKLPSAPLPEDHKAFLHLQLLLGQRIGEVARMRRHEVKLAKAQWTIPAERSKNKHATIVPLPPTARTILATWLSRNAGELVFPNAGGGEHESANIATRLLKAQPHFNFSKADGSPNPFTTHDLRRTCGTFLRQLKVSADVRDAILNHIGARQGSVTEAHYTFADLEAEKHEALTRWQRCIESIMQGHDPFSRSADDISSIEERVLGSNVVALRAVS